MDVKNKIMYHYHDTNVFNELWHVGNVFTIDNTFLANYIAVMDKFSTSVTCVNGETLRLDTLIRNCLKNKDLDIATAKELLIAASTMLKDVNTIQREYILEEVRRKYYGYLPSRKHAIWVCDEQSKDYWQKVLHLESKLELYQVKLNGNLFKSSASLLPRLGTTAEEQREAAHRYWHHESLSDEEEIKSEYLFQGRLEIVKKL